ncbi:MAG: class 1 fructose-bisphosphatase [Halalkalicoccus sp.]
MADDSDIVEEVFETVANCAPEIRAALPGRRTETAGQNPSGELRLAADDYADDLLEERLGGIEGVSQYASEETEESVDVADGASGDVTDGLAVAVDPLDGSSNLKPNNTMGTIVGIYDAPLPAAGRDLVGAAYVLYGPITTMAAAADGEVTEYVVTDGEREAVRETLQLPTDPAVYGFGGRVPDWTEEFSNFVEEIESDESLRLRYGGSMIGDVNQVFTYGGIFAYPALRSAPNGKLRLQFEGNPVGYIVEAAGGRSSDGERSLLEVEPDGLHQRVPVHVGNEALIDRLEGALN